MSDYLDDANVPSWFRKVQKELRQGSEFINTYRSPIVRSLDMEKIGKHTHEFTIPVEWKYKAGLEADNGKGSYYAKMGSKRVTKLRCVCGEETER